MTSRLTDLSLPLLLAAQIALATQMLSVRGPETAISSAPTRDAALASALGDGQFFFRNGALKLINAGNTGGSLIPLREFDYAALATWFRLLDELDSRSRVVPQLAAYWFGFTPKVADSRHVIDYLVDRAAIDAENGWRWQVQAVYFARHRLGDLDLALEIARQLAARDDPDAPFWVAQMPAFVMEEMGEREAALILLESIRDRHSDIPESERRYLDIVIDRLNRPEQ